MSATSPRVRGLAGVVEREELGVEPGHRRMVDTATGEVVLAVISKPRTTHGGRFFMAYQEAFTYLATLNLTGRTRRVLDWMFGQLDFENWLRVSQADCARQLNLDRAAVSRAVKELVELGIIHKGPAIGNVVTYRLDPTFGWKGRAASRNKVMEEARKRGMKVVK